MKRKRRTFSAEFKARVAFEAHLQRQRAHGGVDLIKSQKAVHEIAQSGGVLQMQVRAWKKELQDWMPEVFRSAAKEREQAVRAERLQAHLERKVGQLTTENEKRASARNRSVRKAMIEPGHDRLSLRRQAALLGFNRNRLTVADAPGAGAVGGGPECTA